MKFSRPSGEKMGKARSQLPKNVREIAKLQKTWTKPDKKTKRYDYHEVLESIAWLWRAFGIFPISLNSPAIAGVARYGSSRFYPVYGLILFATCLGNLIYVFINIDYYFNRDPSSLTAISTMIRSTGNHICLFFAIVYRAFQRKEMSEIINAVSEQDVILEKMNCRASYDSSVRIVRAYVFGTLAVLLGLIVYDILSSLRCYNIVTVGYVIWNLGLTIQVIDLTVFVTLIGLLGLNFHALNEKLKTVVTRANSSSPKVIVTSDVCAENLHDVSKAHFNMCAVGKRINRIFGLDVAINMAIAFIILSTTLYYIFYEIQRDSETDVYRIFSYLHWEIFHGAPIITTVLVCNWTTRKSIQAGKLIHEIRVGNVESKLYDAVKSFSLQLHHQKLELTAGGFFPINSTLLQTMIGKITTYLVILIQFEPKLN